MINTRRFIIITSALFLINVLFRHVDLRYFGIDGSLTSLLLPKTSSQHWLILTSTTQLQQYLLAPHPQFSIILIGDHKQADLSAGNLNNIIFLDSQLRATLSFRSTNIRNVAYLLAIKSGARFIFELRSNTPFSPLQHHGRDVQHVAFRRPRSPFVNIHPTFTADFRSSTPGLPEHELNNIAQDGWSSIRTLVHDRQESINALIQQHIPIFYHDLNKSSLVHHPPVAVEPFTFAPFTTDSILFTYDAFWGLALPQSLTDIWRSWWVQRLLWDIGGHLLFAARHLQINATTTPPSRPQDTKEDVRVSKLVRYLTEWTSTKATLVERIDQLIMDMSTLGYGDANEVKMIRDWLADLQAMQYVFPSIKRIASSQSPSGSVVTGRRRTAVCLTGLIECIEEAWKPTARAIRTHIGGDIDVFMYLSSTEPVVDQLATVSQRARIIEALRYPNFTMKVLFENIPKLDPHFPPNCTTDASVDQPEHKVPRYYQQLIGLSNCFSLVRDYEKKHNIKYDLMVRSRADIEFLRIPSTFERTAPYDIDTTLILPPNRFASKVDDGFAIGPIDAVEVYMNRYHSFRKCLTRDLHPERYLYFYLNHQKVKMIIDQNTVVGHIPHSPKHCH